MLSSILSTSREYHVDALFDSCERRSRFIQEFENGDVASIRDDALEEFQQLAGETDVFGTISTEGASEIYALVREHKPKVVVESGVCNGLSTLSILLAMDQNGIGQVHSIDYPYRADDRLKDFRKETFSGYAGAAIPADKDPGWVIPDELRVRWSLRIGKSQRQLPLLVSELDGMDMFVHDSEHSHPCMMFEFELAHEWLSEDGLILADDIDWNDAFDTFTSVRDVAYGEINKSIGWIRKR